jgi:hypothetical protein
MIFLMGFCGAVSAAVVEDSNTDATITGYDIDKVDLEIWPDAATGHDYMKVTVDMITGDKTPGIILIELDADGNTATGGHTSLIGNPFPPCVGGPALSHRAGFDMLISVILREQDPIASTSFCADCSEWDGTAVGPICGNTRFVGEWYVSGAAFVDNGIDADRGRVYMPLPPATETVNGDMCFSFDYTELVDRVQADYVARPTQIPPGYFPFNYALAQDPYTNLQYQISSWYKSGAAPHDDFIDPITVCANVTDAVPGGGVTATPSFPNPPFLADLNNDGKVGSADLLALKLQYIGSSGGVKVCHKP